MATKNISWTYEPTRGGIVLQCIIPCSENSEDVVYLTTAEGDPFSVIMDFKEVIVNALKKRMQSCMSQLMSHVEDIVHATDNRILYNTKHGTKHFCRPSYEAMQSAVEKLNADDINLLSAHEINQIRKALYWVELKDTEKFSVGQLISVLDRAECIIRDNHYNE